MTEFNVKEYWEKRLEKNYGLEGVGYLGHGKAYNGWMYKLRKYIFNKYVSKLKLNLSELSILDIGSGTGFYIECWINLGAKKITGSDITAVAIQNLSSKYKNCNFKEFDISQKDTDVFDSKKFDVISAFDVLFHVVEDDRFIQAINNIHFLLKSEGIFLISDNFVHAETYRGNHHVNRSLNYITEVLKKAGFEILMRKPSFYFLNAPVDTESKFLRWFWNLQSKIIYRGDFYANILGAVVYPVDWLILQFISEGPTTEIMICRKKSL